MAVVTNFCTVRADAGEGGGPFLFVGNIGKGKNYIQVMLYCAVRGLCK